MMNLDTANSGYAKVADLLTQINVFITGNMMRKADIAMVIQGCNMRNNKIPSNNNQGGALAMFAKEMKDLQEQLKVKRFSTFAELFRQNVQFNSIKIDVNSFARALLSLNSMAVNDTTARHIFAALD